MNLFDFALKMEQEAADFYQKLSNAASDKGYRQFFADLASDHEERLRFIETVRAADRPVENSSMQVGENVCNPFRTVSAESGLSEDRDGGLEEAYRYALELEKAEVDCFRGMLNRTRSDREKRLLQTITEEEDRHVEDFRSVYDFINAPNQYLAWGEFSNLAEFHQFGRHVD